jgi:hypothetical protein
MLLVICLVCFFSTLGAVILGQSLKGLLIFKEGLEQGQRKMFQIGAGAMILAILLAIASLFVPVP